MKVMVMVKASKSSEAGEMPSEQLLTEMGAYNEELIKAGIMLTGEGLHPSSKGVRIRFNGQKREVIDGPFAETKELIAGFWMWRVKSMEEAIEWLKKCPNPMNEVSDVEIRPVFEAEDFGPEFTPELREKESSQRAVTLGLSEIRYEDKGEFLVAGLSEHYTEQTVKNIPALWEKFVPVAMKLPNRVEEHTSYGVSYNTSEGCNFDYLAGIVVKSESGLPSGWKSLAFPPRAMPCSPTAAMSPSCPKPSTPFGRSGRPIAASSSPNRSVSSAIPKNSTAKPAAWKSGCR